MIVVLGGTGKTGSALVKVLSGRGVDFKCIVRDVGKARETLGPDIALVEGDLSKPKALPAAMAGADKMFLLSGHSPTIRQQQSDAIDAAKAAGVKYVVENSGAEKGIRADSPIPAPRAMYHIENHLKDSGLDWTILRPNYFMQNLLMAAPGVKADGKLVNPVSGDTVMNMIDVRDTAEVAARVLTEDGHHGKTYALNGPSTTLNDAVAALAKALGREITLVTAPKEAAVARMVENGMPDWLIEHMSAVIDSIMEGGMTGDGAVLMEMLGRAPRTIEDFAWDYRGAFGG